MPVRIEKLEGKAFLAFPEMQNLLLSEIETRFCTDLKPEKTYGELLYFPQWNIGQVRLWKNRLFFILILLEKLQKH